MKNQYFGDKRDFIKYSLIADVLKHHPELSTFAFIPMLTKDDSTNEGNVRKYRCESRDEGVHKFLLENQKNKSIKLWRGFFGNKYPDRSYMVGNLDETPAQNSKAQYFEHYKRQDYFAGITKWKTNSALVFIDADIGIQPVNNRTWGRIINKPEKAEKYILRSEIELLANHISDSVLMIYQHLQNDKRKHKDQAEEKLTVLSGFFGGNASSVRCNDVQYLFASRDSSHQRAINVTLERHASTNKMTFEHKLATP